ncbi:MAG: hypothetical protein KDA27_05830 [Candidatus Eisenbacteria bacterium]|uniref:Cellulose biosynthesis protein BcsS n=1 Tax=Eiseniibacteriota bacterium TaxID=2212470 RepID=A0A956SEH2_UNCEI|nr:hypothetical protein [Candidatus Eisenbacteria bacterium]MCB9466097.1 hypothetical protein [Candidatus Eisenbacteria bacterium]
MRTFAPMLLLGLALGPVSGLTSGTAAASSDSSSATAVADQQAGTAEQVGISETPGSPVAVDWGLTFASRYLFQGQDLSNGKPVAQPELALSYGAISGSLWMNRDFAESHFNEIDGFVSVGRDFSKLWASIGYGYYEYPNRDDWDPSQEIIFDFALAAPVSPTLTVNYDFDAGDGYYATLGGSQALPGQLSTLSAYSNLFYQGSYYDVSGIPAWELGLATERELGGFLFAGAVSRFTTWDNGDFANEGAVPANWYFSLSIVGSN